VLVKVISFVNIVPPVIVQVADGDTQAIAQRAAVNTCFLRNICKMSPLVHKQPASRLLINFTAQGCIAISIYRVLRLVKQEAIQLAVVVIVEKGRLCRKSGEIKPIL